MKHVHALYEEGGMTTRVLVSCESRARVLEGVHILPVVDFLERLWMTGFS